MITTNDFSSMSVLVTGGTRGIGLETALAYGRQGARSIITHRWGSVPDNEILERFEREGAAPPLIVECDVANRDDLKALLDTIARDHDRVDVFVSNVAYGQLVGDLPAYKLRGLNRTIENSLWPIVSYTDAIEKRFGAYPRYVIGLSSFGHRYFTPNYDFIATTKGALEAMVGYLGARLYDVGCRANIVRASIINTESAEVTLGHHMMERLNSEFPAAIIAPEVVANAVLALGSGLLDGVNGQVLCLDNGSEFEVLPGFFNEIGQPPSKQGTTRHDQG